MYADDCDTTSRRWKCYKNFLFDGENSVCKDFYLSTLTISQRIVYDVHGKKDVVSDVTKPDGRSKHNKHHPLVSEANRQSEIDHINSFPVVDSHYCGGKNKQEICGSWAQHL